MVVRGLRGENVINHHGFSEDPFAFLGAEIPRRGSHRRAACG